MPHIPEREREIREFYRRYGEAMSRWADLEHYLGNLFIILAKLDHKVGRAVFYSARSFQGRADMIAACVPFAKTVPAGKDFIDKLVKRARRYSEARNALAHNRHAEWTNWFDGGSDFRRYIQSPEGDEISLPEIACAAFNFYQLTDVVKRSFGRTSLILAPELSLELLALLPTDPLSSAADQSRVEPILSELEHLQW